MGKREGLWVDYIDNYSHNGEIVLDKDMSGFYENGWKVKDKK